jgi:RimJ/RimL family protein N-acetyltransferase
VTRPLRPPDPPLGDDVIALRRWRTTDIPVLTEICQDADVQRFTRVPSPYREAEAKLFLTVQDSGWLEGTQAAFAVIAAAAPAGLVGSIDLRLGPDGRGEIGYLVAAPARGRGVATRAVRLLSDWAFDVHGVARIEILVRPDNLASLRVAENAGYVREGILRDRIVGDDGPHDGVCFSLLPRDRVGAGVASPA